MHAKTLLVLVVAVTAAVACAAVIVLEASASAQPTELSYDWRGHETWWGPTKAKFDNSDKKWFKNTWSTFNQHLAAKVRAQRNLVKNYDSFHTSSYDPNVKVRNAVHFKAEAYSSEPLDYNDQPVIPVMKNNNFKY